MPPSPQASITVAGGVGFITLARPERLNAVTAVMLEEVACAIAELNQDASVRVIVLTGEGRASSAGADITTTDPDDPSDPGQIAPDMLDALACLIAAIHSSVLPVIAAINGLAVGVGASISFACDRPVATDSAYFSLSFVNLGLVPMGARPRPSRLRSARARAMRLALLGDRISAPEAERWGLIADVYPDDEFEVRVTELAARLRGSARRVHSDQVPHPRTRKRPRGDHACRETGSAPAHPHRRIRRGHHRRPTATAATVSVRRNPPATRLHEVAPGCPHFSRTASVHVDAADTDPFAIGAPEC